MVGRIAGDKLSAAWLPIARSRAVRPIDQEHGNHLRGDRLRRCDLGRRGRLIRKHRQAAQQASDQE
jgi:hypothetical protein